MLSASVSCWARLFLQHLRRWSSNPRNWWSMDPSASREISLTVRWLWGLSSWLSNSDSTVSTFSSVHALRLPVDWSELHQQPVDAVIRPTFVQKFCYKLPSVATFTFIQILDQNFMSFTEQRQSCRVCLIQRQTAKYRQNRSLYFRAIPFQSWAVLLRHSVVSPLYRDDRVKQL